LTGLIARNVDLPAHAAACDLNAAFFHPGINSRILDHNKLAPVGRGSGG
jgi:hypothetical protein